MVLIVHHKLLALKRRGTKPKASAALGGEKGKTLTTFKRLVRSHSDVYEEG
jgi:hypothetical protein